MRKIWPQADCSYKRKIIWKAFLDNSRYSSLILHQNSISSSFLEINGNVEDETISMNQLILCYIKIHWFPLHLEWSFSPMYDFVTCIIGHLENIGLFSYANLNKCWHNLLCNIKKSCLLKSPPVSSEKYLCIEKLWSS